VRQPACPEDRLRQVSDPSQRITRIHVIIQPPVLGPCGVPPIEKWPPRNSTHPDHPPRVDLV
jgi:hypothetical protein